MYTHSEYEHTHASFVVKSMRGELSSFSNETHRNTGQSPPIHIPAQTAQQWGIRALREKNCRHICSRHGQNIKCNNCHTAVREIDHLYVRKKPQMSGLSGLTIIPKDAYLYDLSLRYNFHCTRCQREKKLTRILSSISPLAHTQNNEAYVIRNSKLVRPK